MRRTAGCSRARGRSCTPTWPTGSRAGWARRSSTTRRSAGTSSRRTVSSPSSARSTPRGARSAGARCRGAAGRRALAREDVAVAADLLGRAMARLDAADPARAELALDWCEALLAAGEVGPAADAIAELGRWLGADLAAADRLRG